MVQAELLCSPEAFQEAVTHWASLLVVLSTAGHAVAVNLNQLQCHHRCHQNQKHIHLHDIPAVSVIPNENTENVATA